jgi:hypothetical protein
MNYHHQKNTSKIHLFTNDFDTVFLFELIFQVVNLFFIGLPLHFSLVKFHSFGLFRIFAKKFEDYLDAVF